MTDVWGGFWSPSFWLPANTTWRDLQSTDALTYPDFIFVCVAVLLSAVVVFVRFIVERYLTNVILGVNLEKCEN